ncbi:MAG: Ig-like domain-containing protein, partial [Firmicutes bacterium]|nr:Ig-like domain-containing protein [Bacillota bacterium]
MQTRKRISLLLVFAMICTLLLPVLPAGAATPSVQLAFVPAFTGQQLVAAGSSVTLQASAAGATGYSFWVCDPVNGWQFIKYGQDATHTINNVKAGTYLVDAYAFFADGTYAGKREIFNVGSSVALTVASNSNGTYTATAAASNLGCKDSTVYYAFFYTTDKTNYTAIVSPTTSDAYGPESSATIPAGATQVIVYAKEKQAPLGWQTAVADVKDTALAVTSVSAINTNNVSVPLANATNVQSNASFKVVFDSAIDSTTVTSSTVKLFQINTDGTQTQVGLTGIGLDSTDTTNKTVVARPAVYLTKAANYSLQLTTGIKNTAGKSLAANASYNFTTDRTAVIVANGMTANATGVFAKNANLAAGDIGNGNWIYLQYDSMLDTNTVTSSNVKVKDLTASGTPYVPYTLSTTTTALTNDTIVLTWTAASLTAGHKYQIEINNVNTAAGYPAASDVIPFTANDSALTINTVVTKDNDNVLTGSKVYPTVAGGFIYPAEVATYKQGCGLVVTFNGTPMASTLTSSNVYITVKGQTTPVPATVTWTTADSSLRINPTVDLAEKTTYTLHIGTGV